MEKEKFRANGWTADLPGGWEDRSMITLVNKADESGFLANIVVTKQTVKARTSITDYAAEQARLMQQETDTLQILDQRSIEINGVESFQRLQQIQLEDGRIIQQVQTFFADGQIIYTITGTAALENFDQSTLAFKEFVETFRFQK